MESFLPSNLKIFNVTNYLDGNNRPETFEFLKTENYPALQTLVVAAANVRFPPLVPKCARRSIGCFRPSAAVRDRCGEWLVRVKAVTVWQLCERLLLAQGDPLQCVNLYLDWLWVAIQTAALIGSPI